MKVLLISLQPVQAIFSFSWFSLYFSYQTAFFLLLQAIAISFQIGLELGCIFLEITLISSILGEKWISCCLSSFCWKDCFAFSYPSLQDFFHIFINTRLWILLGLISFFNFFKQLEDLAGFSTN